MKGRVSEEFGLKAKALVLPWGRGVIQPEASLKRGAHISSVRGGSRGPLKEAALGGARSESRGGGGRPWTGEN